MTIIGTYILTLAVLMLVTPAIVMLRDILEKLDS